jgi:hypothetical protein
VFYINDCITIKQGEQLIGTIAVSPNPKNKVRGTMTTLYLVFVTSCEYVMRNELFLSLSLFPSPSLSLSPHTQRDLDFTVTYSFDGELMQLNAKQDYHMR